MKPYTMSQYVDDKALWADMRADIAKLEAELSDLRYVQGEITKRVCPGTTDSVDAVREIVRERDRMREALEKIAAPAPDEELPSFSDDYETWTYAYMKLNRRRRTTAKEALAALDGGTYVRYAMDKAALHPSGPCDEALKKMKEGGRDE